jgi:GTP-binding protein
MNERDQEAETNEESRGSTRYRNLPVVAVAGRPNVGKSTLFNRLLGKRKAITDPTPGVTRDPIESVCVLRDSGKPILLVDTGGFKLDRSNDDGLDDLVVERSIAAIEGADLVLFVVDAMVRTAEDDEFAALLRKKGRAVLVVANKADSHERDASAYEAAAYGFDALVAVSAEHGRNLDDLEREIVERLDFSDVEEYVDEHEDVRIAIMGKPNTGKSTLVNRLLGAQTSIVSDIPGTTRDPIEGRFERKGRALTIIDTAGIRRKKKVEENVEYYSVNRAIKVIDECDIVVLMIDAQEGLTEQDKKITALAVGKGRGLIFALNKWDLIPRMANSFEAARDKLRYFFGQVAFAPVVRLSAREGDGVEALIDRCVALFDQLTRRVETSKLNKAVERWIERTPPPVGPRTRFKLRYATQASANPVRFAFFVTRPEAVADSYVSFLKNQIRSELGFDSVPILLELKASHKDRRK